MTTDTSPIAGSVRAGRGLAVLSVLVLPLMVLGLVLVAFQGAFSTEEGFTAAQNAAAFQERAAGQVMPGIVLVFTDLVLIAIVIAIVGQCLQTRGVPIRPLSWLSYLGIGLVVVGVATELLHSAVLWTLLSADPHGLPGFAEALGGTDASMTMNVITDAAFTFATACAAFVQRAAYPKAGLIIGIVAIVFGVASLIILPAAYGFILLALGIVQLRRRK